jgi:hypothetical protein
MDILARYRQDLLTAADQQDYRCEWDQQEDLDAFRHDGDPGVKKASQGGNS